MVPLRSLPKGITLNSSTGVLSGTTTDSGSFPIVVKVSDSSNPRQTVTENLTLVIDVTSITSSTVTTPTTPTIVLGATDTDKARVSGNATGGETHRFGDLLRMRSHPGSHRLYGHHQKVGSAVTLVAGER